MIRRLILAITGNAFLNFCPSAERESQLRSWVSVENRMATRDVLLLLNLKKFLLKSPLPWMFPNYILDMLVPHGFPGNWAEKKLIKSKFTHYKNRTSVGLYNVNLVIKLRQKLRSWKGYVTKKWILCSKKAYIYTVKVFNTERIYEMDVEKILQSMLSSLSRMFNFPWREARADIHFKQPFSSAAHSVCAVHISYKAFSIPEDTRNIVMLCRFDRDS